MSYRNFIVIGWLGVLYLREKNSQYLAFLLQISDVYIYFVLNNDRVREPKKKK